MKNKNFMVTAIVLSGSLIIGCSSGDRGSAGRSASGASGQGMSSGSGSTSRTAAASSQKKITGKISQSDMRKVEEALQAKGFDPGPINGEMDAQTQRALRDYQSKNKLAVTGAMDQATADSLGIVVIFLPE